MKESNLDLKEMKKKANELEEKLIFLQEKTDKSEEEIKEGEETLLKLREKIETIKRNTPTGKEDTSIRNDILEKNEVENVKANKINKEGSENFQKTQAMVEEKEVGVKNESVEKIIAEELARLEKNHSAGKKIEKLKTNPVEYFQEELKLNKMTAEGAKTATTKEMWDQEIKKIENILSKLGTEEKTDTKITKEESPKVAANTLNEEEKMIKETENYAEASVDDTNLYGPWHQKKKRLEPETEKIVNTKPRRINFLDNEREIKDENETKETESKNISNTLEEEIKPGTESEEKTQKESIAVFITKRMTQDLLDLGYSMEEINEMTPDEANHLIYNQKTNKNRRKKTQETKTTEERKEPEKENAEENKTPEAKDEQAEAPKSAEEIKKDIESKIEIEEARKEYFRLKNNKKSVEGFSTPDGLKDHEEKIKNAEENYKNIKNKISKEFLDKGEKEKALEFLFAEKELDRNNDIKNKLVGKKERWMSALSKGIEKWDNFGKEEGWKGVAKRAAKMSLSLGLIGLSSSKLVELGAQAGVISASALSGGTMSYVGRKLGFGTVFGTVIGSIPEKHRKWVGGAMMAVSAGIAISGAGTAAAGVGVVSASLFGLGLSKLTKRYDKKIKERIESSKNKIDLSDLATAEKEIENILRQNEKTRVLGKITEAATALAGSIAYLGISGATHDMASGHKAEVEHSHTAEMKHDEGIKHSTDLKQEEIKHDADLKHQEDIKHTEEIKHQAEVKHQEEVKHEAEQLKDATIHKGEGIEHGFIRQIEHNHELAKELGFKGDINDAKALHEFAGREAHILAMKEGYVDNANHQVWVKEGDKVAYEIKMENGHPIVIEKDLAGGNIIETHHEGDKFEQTVDKHEYIHTTHHEPVPQETRSEYVDTSKEPADHSSRTEYVDTSKGHHDLNQDADSKSVAEAASVKEAHILGRSYTEEAWSKAPENVYHISLDDLKKVESMHSANLHHLNDLNNNITSELSHGERGEVIERINSTLRDGRAEAFVGIKGDDVQQIYQPLHHYINKLHEVTGLKPTSTTILHDGETNHDYILRALMKAMSIGKLDKIKF